GREVVDAETEAAIAEWSGPTHLFLPADPSPEDLRQALEAARTAKAVVLLVTDARRREGQRRLAEALDALPGTPLVLVAAQSPYDLPLLPQAAVRLASYGEAPASLQALGKSLFTPFRFTGRAPAVFLPTQVQP
ncbi:MAG: beta-N-acetylhexosaminidase, partial [Acidobacteriota bacterium]